MPIISHFFGILVKFSHCSLQAFGLMCRIKLRVAIREKRVLFATIRRISYICSQLIKIMRQQMKSRHILQWAVAMLLAVVTVLPAGAQYGSRGDKRYRDRYSRTNTYGDVVEIRLSEPGTLESKMPPEMVNKVRLLHIEGPMDSRDFKFLKKICDRSRCVDGRDKSVDNYIDVELERVRIMSAGSSGLFGSTGSHDVLDDALAYSSHLRSIVLPERLKRIGNNALHGCSQLEEVIMPPGVRSLGDDAFSGCHRLEFIVLPEGLQEIGQECFSGCEKLRNITIPRSVVEIGEKAFKGTALQRVTLPYGLTSLGSGAFDKTALIELDLPAATRIGDDYLGYMPKLQEIRVENCSRYYTYEDGALYDNTGSVLLLYPAGRNGVAVVPDGVETIGKYAFAGSAIAAVDMPATVSTIGYRAFAESSIESVTLPVSVTSVGESAFESCSRLQRAEMPGVKAMGKCAFKHCGSLKSFTTSPDITVIPQEAFEECRSLTSVKLPASVTTITMRAFKNCPAIADVEFPIGLTEIGKEAFEGCKALTAIDLPSALKSIGERAFKNCRGLTSVSLPEACKTLDKEAFRECTALTHVELGNVTSLGDNALRETAITVLVLPESVTHLGKKVAEKCKELTRIECHAVLPPTLDKESNSKIELRVPATSVSAYRSAKNWKSFKNILPLE